MAIELPPMPLDLRSPGAVEQFERALGWVDAELPAWLVARAGLTPAEATRHLLGAGALWHYKLARSDGHLTCWRGPELHEFFVEWAPRELALDPSGGERFWAAAVSLLEMLDHRGLLAPEGDPLDLLVRVAHELRAPFLRSLGTGTRSPAQVLVQAMIRDGVDLGDGKAVLRWIEAVGGAGFPGGPGGAGRFGQVHLDAPLPDPAEVEASAASVELIGQIRGLVAFLGESGRQLTPERNLPLDDVRELVCRLGTGDRAGDALDDPDDRVRALEEVPGLTVVVRLARAARWVRPYRGRLVSTRAGRALGADPLGDVQRLLAAAIERGPASCRYGGGRWIQTVLAPTFDAMVAPLLVSLLPVGRGKPLAHVVDSALADLDAQLGPATDPRWNDEFRRSLTGDLIGTVIDVLGRVGVLLPPTGGPAAGDVVLSPVGRMLAAELARGRGLVVCPPRHTGASFPELVDALRGQPFAAFSAELEAWIAARPPEEAVTSIAGFAAATDHVGGRGLALATLSSLALRAEPGRGGPDVVGAVRSLLDHPSARGAALLWLVEHGHEEAGALLDPEPAVVVDVLAHSLAQRGPQSLVELLALAGDVGAQIGLLRRLWRVPSPTVASVLDVLGGHPVAPVAKAARKAAMQHRSLAVSG